MASSRRLLGFLISILLVAFSLPVLADSGDKFSAVMSPTSPPAQSGPITFTATIKNLARFDYLKSYTVTIPAGLTISGTPTASSGSVSVSGQVVSVSGTMVAYTKTTQLTIKAAPASALSCGPNALLWGATAKGGLFVNNEVFNLDSSSVLQTTVTKLCYTLTYGAGSCASVTGTTPQTVGPGGSGTPVSALPLAHNHFVSWSDGSTANPRTDTNVNANVNVTASCAIDTFTLTYTGGSGGSIVGTTPQTVAYGGSGTPVTGQANALFSFASWSDASTANPRTDTNVTGNINVTASFVPNTLTITAKPTSAALNAPFDVTVGINPGPATVTADTSACGNASVSTKSSTPTSATLTFTIPAAATITTCTLAFSATNYSSPTPLSLKVLAGQTTACSSANPSNPPPPGSQFTASCATGGINVTGFAAGVRGPNKAGACDPLNFTLTNTICGAVAMPDANGNLIPPNGVSFVWDQSQSAAFTYTVTWKSEYVDITTGLPVSGRTKYCTGTGPTACDTTQTLKACLSTLVAFGSIPAGNPACISEEGWAVVLTGDTGGDCTGLPNPNGDNPPPACVRVTTTIIDALDPGIIRP
jgi:hypothetical protein